MSHSDLPQMKNLPILPSPPGGVYDADVGECREDGVGCEEIGESSPPASHPTSHLIARPHETKPRYARNFCSADDYELLQCVDPKKTDREREIVVAQMQRPDLQYVVEEGSLAFGYAAPQDPVLVTMAFESAEALPPAERQVFETKVIVAIYLGSESLPGHRPPEAVQRVLTEFAARAGGSSGQDPEGAVEAESSVGKSLQRLAVAVANGSDHAVSTALSSLESAGIPAVAIEFPAMIGISGGAPARVERPEMPAIPVATIDDFVALIDRIERDGDASGTAEDPPEAALVSNRPESAAETISSAWGRTTAVGSDRTAPPHQTSAIGRPVVGGPFTIAAADRSTDEINDRRPRVEINDRPAGVSPTGSSNDQPRGAIVIDLPLTHADLRHLIVLNQASHSVEIGGQSTGQGARENRSPVDAPAESERPVFLAATPGVAVARQDSAIPSGQGETGPEPIRGIAERSRLRAAVGELAHEASSIFEARRQAGFPEGRITVRLTLRGDRRALFSLTLSMGGTASDPSSPYQVVISPVSPAILANLMTRGTVYDPSRPLNWGRADGGHQTVTALASNTGEGGGSPGSGENGLGERQGGGGGGTDGESEGDDRSSADADDHQNDHREDQHA